MSGPRVLVVDDEQQILRALRTSLRAAGYEVDTAETAEGALAAAALRPPEAMILDLVLPDGTGTDVCREFRSWSSAPVIILSAVGEEREKVAALDAGADDYVTKPVGIDELLARLRAVLRRTSPSGEPVIQVGELLIDLEKRSVSAAGARSLDASPVRPPAGVRAQSRQAPHPEDAPARGLGPRVPRRVESAPRERVAVAPQNRARPGASALLADRAWRRLPPRRSDRLVLQAFFRAAGRIFRRPSAARS